MNRLKEIVQQIVNEDFHNISSNRKEYLFDNIRNVINNPFTTAAEMHREWSKVRFKDGWKYGETTDRDNKIPDCLVPYDQLNFHQKLKDHLVVETIKMYYGMI